MPDGDPELQRAWLDDYLSAVQWMRENQIPIAPRFDGIMTIGADPFCCIVQVYANVPAQESVSLSRSHTSTASIEAGSSRAKPDRRSGHTRPSLSFSKSIPACWDLGSRGPSFAANRPMASQPRTTMSRPGQSYWPLVVSRVQPV